jgi:hypothetical protein
MMLVLSGCDVRQEPPPGVSCQRWAQADGDSALNQALSAASSGTCVVAQTGVYRQALVVPQGVALLGEAGGAVEFTGGSETESTLVLGPGAVVAGVSVTASSAGIGIRGEGKGEKLFRVTVSGGRRAGVVFWCEEDCRTDELSDVSESTISGAALGLITRGVKVRLKNGSVTKSAGTGLASGYGVVAFSGAVLEVDGTVIEQNESLGVLFDGAGETETTLTRTTIKENQGRGVWAQGMMGTLAAPKLKLVDTTIERNALVGVGVRNSTGISVIGGRIAGTQLRPTAGQTPGVLVMVGDGLGLFENTAEARVEGAALEANERSQALIDSAGDGIVLSQTVRVAAGQALGVVVQRTTPRVDAPNITRPTPGTELSVSSPQLALPTR